MTTSEAGRPLRTAVAAVVHLRLADAADPNRAASGGTGWSNELERLLEAWDLSKDKPDPSNVRLVVDRLFAHVDAVPDAQAQARELDRYVNGSGNFW